MRLAPIHLPPPAPEQVSITEEEILADLLYPAPHAGGAGARGVR